MKLTRDRLIKLIKWNNHVSIDEKRFVLGFAAGDQTELCKPSSFLIGGLPDMGKTQIMSYLACQAVILGSRLLFIDPHGNEGAHGLMSKVSPLRPWFARDTIDAEDSEAALKLLLWMEEELHRREARGGMVGKHLLFLFIDEFNEFLSRFDKDDLATVNRILSVLGRGGRKFGLYLILCGHNWTLGQTGAVRKAVGGRICVNCERGDMSMVMDVEQKMLTPYTMTPLLPGDAVVKHPRKGLLRLRYPLCNREQVAPLAYLMRETVGFPQDTPRLRLLKPVPLGSVPVEECGSPVTGTADEARAANEPSREAMRREEVRWLPQETEKLRVLGQKEPGNQGNHKRKLVTQETLDSIIYWRMKGESHRKIRKIVKLEGKYYEEMYVPACQHLGLELDHDAPMNPREWLLLKQHYNWTCLACGKREPEIELEPDHVVPRSKGGSDALRNRQPLCKPCNCRKKDRTIDYRKGQADKPATLIESREDEAERRG